MHKIWLVVQREYVTRVRNKTFIISTFLTPLFFAALIFAIIFFSAKSGAPDTVATGHIFKKEMAAEDGHKSLAYAIGYLSSFLVYITILIYGTTVMRGVSEEKTSRIAEVVISSVKPFQLMMGKILGIGAVGLTQLFLWGVLLLLLATGMSLLLPTDILQEIGSGQPSMSNTGLQLSSINLPLIIFCFIFYFVFGYLFYASLFAAVGSAVSDDAQDTQSLMLPVTMPIVLAIVMMMSAIAEPGGSLATWSSIVPFFSPVVMMARLPFGVPATVAWWELGLSMLLLVGGFLAVTWLSGKIYRIGILMYGKKTTWKEMWKWMMKS